MKHLFLYLLLFGSIDLFAMDKFCNGSAISPHLNGGGNVAHTAAVSATVYVGPEAAVCDYARVTGTAEIRDNSRVYGVARIEDKVVISGNVHVFGNAYLSSHSPQAMTISDDVKVYGNARIFESATIKGGAFVSENAQVNNSATVEGTAKVFGNATVTGQAVIQGNAKIHGRATIGGNVVASTSANICEGRYFFGGTILNTTICRYPTNSLLTTTQVAIGKDHMCSLYTTGRIRCWGLNTYGQLGLGNTTIIGDNEFPSTTQYVNVGGVATHIAAGTYRTCAILVGGTVRCWGNNQSGQLGLGHTTTIGDNELPSSVDIVDVGGVVTNIVMGEVHTCALLDTGKVRCWGPNNWGQIGYANSNPIGDNEHPYTAGDVNIGGNAVQLTAGANHTCALLDTGAVTCWGNNPVGQLGYGNTLVIGDNETPASAGTVNVGGAVTQITAGTNHTCALLNTGNVRCWGSGQGGVLGYGNTTTIGNVQLPYTAGDIFIGGSVSRISSGDGFNCAHLISGSVRCWGLNTSGQLGLGHTNSIGDNELPASVGDISVGSPFTQIFTGSSSACALLANGKLRCWGNNSFGVLGYGPSVGDIGDNELPSSMGEVNNFVSKKLGAKNEK